MIENILKIMPKQKLSNIMINKDFKMLYVKDVVKETPREDELFDYANVQEHYRTIITPLYEEDYDNCDYE